ncbi:T9SS type A sorting domain-containing protein, partial [Hymenobacter persicinus]
QPDGKLLVAGALIEAGLSYYTRGVTRLLPDGAPDNTFSVGQGFSNPVKHLLLQPDGRMLAVGTFGSVNTLSTLGVARLLANGTPDASFRVNPPTVFIREPHAAVLQPDGKVVVSGFFNKFSGGTTFGLVRYRPDGSEDPTFANSTEFTNASGYVPLYGLALQADGKLLVGGEFSRYGSQDVRNLIRLQPSGQLDPSFAPDLSWRRLGEATVQAILIQPNGRLLTSGTIFSTNIGSTAPFMARFQPDGAPDASFSAPIFTDRTGPASISVQPSGAVLLYGYFARLRFGTAGPYVESPLVRIDAGNVLAVGGPRSLARTEAWPVPVHDALHLRLEAAAQPRQLALVDALGRTVRQQPVSQTELTLPVAGLPAGVYLLRIDYAAGVVTRRIVVE